MNRRDVLKYGGALGALGALGTLSRTGTASPPPTQPMRRLLLVLAQGGWDTVYSIDPKLQSPTVDVPVGTIQQFGNSNVLTDPSRPNVAAFFTKYGAQTAIVNGLSVASVAHEECVKRICTGTRSETSADMGAIVGHDNGNSLPLPYLILGDQAFAGPYAVSAGRVGATNQIIALLDPSQAYRTNNKPVFVTNAAEDALLETYASAAVNRARAARGAVGYNRKRVDDFASAIDRGKALQAPSIRAGFGHRGATLKLANQIPLAVDALSQGISQAVMLNTRLTWDTHTVNANQAGFHDTTFVSMTTLLDLLASKPGLKSGTTMLDDTVVVLCSEMGRSPRLNANAGKDHWPVTSAVVMGAGVKGGRSYGATNDSLQAQLVDYTTGAASPNGLPLSFPNFAAGVLSICGVDPANHLSDQAFNAFVA
ncbi:MAG: hypothetical protein JWO36_3629 [Myxococcales bacterium]|nr:hypothetical protein [Myxococcales bacterium]